MTTPALQQQLSSVPAFTWAAFVSQLEKNIGKAAVKSWIMPLAFVFAAEEKKLTLKAPTRFLQNWVQSRYRDALVAAAAAVYGEAVSVEILVAPTDITAVPSEGASARADEALDESAFEIANDEASPFAFLSTALDPKMTFERFVVGASNEVAYAAARRVAESDAPVFNPLFFHGGVGLGKTHLAQAIGHALKARAPKSRIMYLSAEKFMFQFVKAIRQKDTMAFKEAFRSIDVLIIDDIQFICGKESTQAEFLQTLTALMDQKRQVILCADKSPHDLTGLDERLKSRLSWGFVADIHEADEVLRHAILKARAAEAKHPVPSHVIDFLVERVNSNIRELEGAFQRLQIHADLTGQAITMDMVQLTLRDLLRMQDRVVSIENIQRTVAEFYGIKMADMASSRRLQAVARPRQVAMYLAKHMTTASLPKMGQLFGGRDHTTIMHGIRKIEDLLVTDPSTKADIEKLKRLLRG
jgi:chromosomal replication initiator protein